MRSSITAAFTVLLALGFGSAFTSAARAADAPEKETSCTDGVDDDLDTVTDCADADCAADPACQPDGVAENSNERCHDWIDNDSDGHIDCDDSDCEGPGITACEGSWDKQQKAAAGNGSNNGNNQALPELPAGSSFEDLLGKAGDIDGERNDQDCADGIDNDGDGAVDCADFGCRFDPSVLVCREAPNIRFSVVSFIQGSYNFESEEKDFNFKTLQLRAFGPIPFIQDSFFLLSSRFEKSPRLTFAMFQIPIGGGYYLNINSGGGGLTSALIRSATKQLLVEAPYYLYSAFEQGNGAAVEIGGPITNDGKLNYYVFGGGGSGRYSGNVGGRYFTYDNTNFTYAFGAQLDFNAIGHTSRWDSPMLFVPVPTALNFRLGAKYDQRAQERYPAFNMQATFKSGPLILLGEGYLKRELEFESWQGAYNFQVGFLAIKKTLLLAADFGQYLAGEMKNPPAVAETDIRRQDDETQWRIAAHWYFFRNIGVLSLLYDDHVVKDNATGNETHDRILSLIAQYRF